MYTTHRFYFEETMMGKKEDDAAYYARNAEKIKARANAYYYGNKEQVLTQQKAYYEANKVECIARNREWADKNRPRMRKYHQEYVKRNRDLWSHQTAIYRAQKKRATPPWASRERIRGWYALARQRKTDTGVEHHVDHVVPLQSHLVCGLHVPWNLQVLTGRANRKKSNFHWPDMPDDHYDVHAT